MKLRPEFGLQHAPAGLYMGCECTLGTLRRHHENKLPAMFILISPFQLQHCHLRDVNCMRYPVCV
jgi:hypothetical protein